MQRAKKAAAASASGPEKKDPKATTSASSTGTVNKAKPQASSKADQAAQKQSSTTPVIPAEVSSTSNQNDSQPASSKPIANKPLVKQQQPETSGSSTNLASNIVNKSKLFLHFDQYKRDYSIIEKFNIDNPKVHPAFIKLGWNLNLTSN